MIERIRKKYAMTEKGAKDYVAAVFWSVLVNISKMLPVGVLATALSGMAYFFRMRSIMRHLLPSTARPFGIPPT